MQNKLQKDKEAGKSSNNDSVIGAGFFFFFLQFLAGEK